MTLALNRRFHSTTEFAPNHPTSAHDDYITLHSAHQDTKKKTADATITYSDVHMHILNNQTGWLNKQ